MQRVAWQAGLLFGTRVAAGVDRRGLCRHFDPQDSPELSAKSPLDSLIRKNNVPLCSGTSVVPSPTTSGCARPCDQKSVGARWQRC